MLIAAGIFSSGHSQDFMTSTGGADILYPTLLITLFVAAECRFLQGSSAVRRTIRKSSRNRRIESASVWGILKDIAGEPQANCWALPRATCTFRQGQGQNSRNSEAFSDCVQMLDR
jgi:hypothetical protein